MVALGSRAVAFRRPGAPALGLGFAYSFTSLGVAQKYAGTAAALVLLGLAPLVGLFAVRLLGAGDRLVSGRAAELAAVALLVLAVVALLVVYPHANTHAPGQGSDRDDAATIGARGLLHGESPYGSFTYLHNPISQLPTLLVVAMPFVALFGSSAYALVVFLPLLYVLWRLLGGPRRAAACLAVALASPMLLRDYLTGGDLVTNTVLVVGAVALVWRAAGRGALVEVAAAVALGVVLATRANFAAVLVPLLVGLLRRHGASACARTGIVAVACFAALTLPVALTRGGREAIRMNDKLQEIPGGAPLVLSLVAVLALLLAARTRAWTLPAVFAQAAVVQVLFLLAVVVNTSVDSGRPDFFWLISSYGIPTYLLALSALAAAGPSRLRA